MFYRQKSNYKNTNGPCSRTCGFFPWRKDFAFVNSKRNISVFKGVFESLLNKTNKSKFSLKKIKFYHSWKNLLLFWIIIILFSMTESKIKVSDIDKQVKNEHTILNSQREKYIVQWKTDDNEKCCDGRAKNYSRQLWCTFRHQKWSGQYVGYVDGDLLANKNITKKSHYTKVELHYLLFVAPWESREVEW